ncbi:Fc.00g015800.m01.CDS01 [Cosmosporella sp. VM-42]
MFPTIIRRMASPISRDLLRKAPLSVANNPYKARKVWPPNFKELSHQQQLRFEKKYKRRITLASRSPRWIKGVKFAQLITIVAALVYLLFYSEFEWWGQEYKPHEEIRKKTAYLFGTMDPDKRYERRKDAPLPPPPKDQPESK